MGEVPYELLLVGGAQHRFYRAEGAPRGAVIYVGGAGGGFESPADGLYLRLCDELAPRGIAGLRTRFRSPGDIEGCTADVLAGAEWLAAEGHDRLALVGHSFGGAIAVRAAAAAAPVVGTVVTLATQVYGAEAIATLGEEMSLLAVHGEDDEVLPAACSVALVSHARCEAELVLVPGAGHLLDEVADDLFARVRDWVEAHLPLV